MNAIKITLDKNASGKVAELYKDFAMYVNSYQNKLVDVYVPKEMLYTNPQSLNVDETPTQFANSVKIGGILTADNGSKITTDSYYMDFLKETTINGVDYVVFERIMPKELTTYAGNQQIVINVLSVDSSVTPVKVLQVVTTQICNLLVQNSDYIGDKTVVDPTKTEEFDARITQNKTDIVDLKTRMTTTESNVEQNTEDIAQNRDAINSINETIATGQTYIGTLTIDHLPTDQELNDFVLEKTGVVSKGGDTVIVILQVADDTDKNYKYIYNGTTWSGYEIPPMEQASNGTRGIVEGTYGIGLNNNTLVDISGGQILNIYVKDKDGTYQNIQTYLNMNAQGIEDIINGDSVVGEAMKAVQDGLGNNIANTYLTQVLGATKQFVRDYAQPREISNVYFISTQGYSTQVPTTPESGIQFSVNTNTVGSFQMFQIEKINTASFELTSINGYANNLYISASADCDVQFRLTTEYQKVGENWGTLNVELSNITQMRAGDIQRIQLNSPFTALGDNVLSLATGDKIRQTLEVVTQTITPLVFNLYSNEVYPSTFAITSQSYVLEDIEKSKSQIILMGADGVVQSGNIVMTIQDANSFVEYRTNQREFIIDGNIPVVGTIDNTYPISIKFGETVYNIYSFMKGTSTPLTFGDIASSTTYNQAVGYSFNIRVLFIETSDITGFVLSPATLTAKEILNLISDDGTVIGSIGADNKLNLMLKTEIQNRITRALVTPTSAPTETELVGIDENNSQVSISAGNGISIKNNVISGIKSEIAWSGNFAYLANEQTMSLDLSKYKYVEFMTSIGNILPMNLQDTRPNGDLYVYLNASSYYNGSWHDGAKCEGTYYYGTKQIKWSGNYCGLTQVRGYWW